MSTSYDTQGTIHSIGETTEHGSNGFTKREFIIKLTGDGENPEYPNHMPCELIKDKTSLLDQFQIGNEVKVTFNLGGNLWAGNGSGERAFATLKAWKLELLNVGQQQAAPQPNAYEQQAPGTGGAQPPNYDAMIKEYKGSSREQQTGMWARMDAAEQAALSAALS